MWKRITDKNQMPYMQWLTTLIDIRYGNADKHMCKWQLYAVLYVYVRHAYSSDISH